MFSTEIAVDRQLSPHWLVGGTYVGQSQITLKVLNSLLVSYKV